MHWAHVVESRDHDSLFSTANFAYMSKVSLGKTLSGLATVPEVLGDEAHIVCNMASIRICIKFFI